MISAGTHRLTLGRVTLHLPDETADREAWRRRACEALGRVDIHLRLPPQAILVVRRMPDPQPGLLLEENGWRGAQQWSGHTQTWLDACWRRAARPAYESVPASADAVWFADLAEWLACLSWDVHVGLTTARWWWETWLPQLGYGSVGDMLFKLWQGEARWLPQALSLVQAQHGQGVYTLLWHLGSEQARHIRQLVLASHGLPAGADERHVRSALLPLLPQSAQRAVRELPPQSAALAAVCLGVVHVPAAARRQLYATDRPPPQGAHEGLEQAAHDIGQRTPPNRQMSALPPQNGDAKSIVQDVESTEKIVAPSAAPSSVDESVASAPDAAIAPDLGATSHGEHPIAIQDAAEERSEAIDEDLAGPYAEIIAHADAEYATPEERAALLSEMGDAQSGAAPTAYEEQGVRTEYGGVWYLVSILAELGWLEDGAYALDGWAKLAGLAKAVLVDAEPDPIWELLAAQTVEEASDQAVATWLNAARPAVQEYIAERLEVPAAFTEALRDPATLYVTRTHVDVAFSIEQIRLEFRAAGLDRDPGWVPELGRVVAFHYE